MAGRAAPKPKTGDRYKVIGAVAVIRKDGHERYVDHGGQFNADALDEDNAVHLLGVGLIEVVEAPADPDAGLIEVVEAPADPDAGTGTPA